MDYLKSLKSEQLVQISEQFDYLTATSSFIGTKLFPMVKTDSLKVAMYQLAKDGNIPVVALIHAFDSESRIADRPNYEEFKEQLFLIKAKINQGEELKKKIKDMGMTNTETNIINSIYDDINNLISQVLTGFERRACEALCKAKLTINENGSKYDVNYNLDSSNKIDFTGWNDVDHDIIADMVKLNTTSKNKIVRQIISSKVMGYMLNNTKLAKFAENTNTYLTEAFVKTYFQNLLGIEIIINDDTFKLSHQDSTQYRFFDEMVIVSLTTKGEVGKMFMTSTPIEDFNQTLRTSGFVALKQWFENDKEAQWTKAEGVGLPVFADINNTLYLSTVTESTPPSGV